jgi:hypothetical protein
MWDAFVLTLPSKPWKRVAIAQMGEAEYLIRLISPLKEPAEFDRIVREDLEPCLGPQDKLTDPIWESRSVRLITSDFNAFKKRLIFQGIVITKDR